MEQQIIPVFTLEPEVNLLWSELQVVIQGVLRSGHFIMGPNVAAFEHEVAEYLGVKHAIGLNSGTDALYIALRALGIGPGDEVITTPFTFFATAEAISHVGATPVFVDIDPRTFTLDPGQVEAAVTLRTKAIIPVHLYGQPAAMDPLMTVARRYGLKVVEDVAQAFGAEYKGKKVGTLGDVGAYSFFPTKNLGAYGDGGLLTTDSDQYAEHAKMLRSHGSKVKYLNEVVGYNSRLDELQAAILRVKLPYVNRWNESRRAIAKRYAENLSDVHDLAVPMDYSTDLHVFHQYTVRVFGGRRDGLKQCLQDAGVVTTVYYPVPLHQLPVYRSSRLSLPVAERAVEEVLSLPIWPNMPVATQLRVIEAIRQGLS